MFCLDGNFLVKFCNCCVMSNGILSKWRFFKCHYGCVKAFFLFSKARWIFQRHAKNLSKTRKNFEILFNKIKKIFKKRESSHSNKKEATENLAWGTYLSEFLMFLREIFFDRKILPGSCDDYRSPGNETQRSDFGRFWRFLIFFELSVLAQAFKLGHWFLIKN